MTATRFLSLAALLVASVLSTPTLAQDCYESSILKPAPFMGNNGEIFKLADGSLWEVQHEYEYMYEYYPAVVICPDLLKLIIDGNSLNVILISEAPSKRGTRQGTGWKLFEETNLRGMISGTVSAGRIFKTTSGNIYEVAGQTLQLVLELQPEVMVLRDGDVYKLIVEGFDEPLICRRLN